MTISFKCPTCAKPFNVPDHLAGKKSKCSCGHQFVIPTATQAKTQTQVSRQTPNPTISQQPAPQQPVPQQPIAPTNPLGGGLPTPPAGNPLGGGLPTPPAGNPLGGGLPTPPAGNPLGGMPAAPPSGGQLGGLPVGGAFPAAPGGNPLGGMPTAAPGMQAGSGWNTPAASQGKGKSKFRVGKKGMLIGISIGAVLLIGGGVTAFLMMGDDAPAGVADDGTSTTQSNPASTSGTGGGATQSGGTGGTSGMMSGMSGPGMGPGMGGDPSGMGAGMMDDPTAGGNNGAGPGTDPAASGNFGAGPGGDPSLGGADPAASGNFGAGPGSDPSLGGADPAAGGNNPFGTPGASPGTDPSGGGRSPGDGANNSNREKAGGGTLGAIFGSLNPFSGGSEGSDSNSSGAFGEMKSFIEGKIPGAGSSAAGAMASDEGGTDSGNPFGSSPESSPFGTTGAGPGTDPAAGGADPFGSSPESSPFGTPGEGPGTDPAAGGADPFGSGTATGNDGGIPSADLVTIRKGLMSNSYEKVAVARLQLLKLTASTLEKIHDASTAIAQVGQFKELEPVFKLASDSTKRIKPSQAEGLQLARKYGVVGKQILEAYQKEVDRVMKVKGFPTQAKLQLQKMIQLSK